MSQKMFFPGQTAQDRKNKRRSQRRMESHIQAYRAAGGIDSAFSDEGIHFYLTGEMT